MMEYRGYRAAIEFDDSIEMFHGRVIGTRDIITFQGKSVDDLRQALAQSIDDYLEFCGETGRPPEKPLSGKFLVRGTPDLQRRLLEMAAQEGVSFNAYVTRTLDRISTGPMESLPIARPTRDDDADERMTPTD